MTTLVEATTDLAIPQQQEATPEAFFRTWRKGTGRSLASAGDLVRSDTKGEESFHVALPFQRISVVDVRMRTASVTNVSCPESLPHVAQAVLSTIEYLGLDSLDVHVRHRTDVPSLSDLGGVSADVTATVRAVALAAGRELTSQEVVSLTAPLSLSSALGAPGIVPVSTSGKILSTNAWWPQYALVVLHPAEPATAPSGALPAGDVPLDDVQAALSSQDSLRVAELASRSFDSRLDMSTHPLLQGDSMTLLALLGTNGLSPDGVALSSDASAVSFLYSMHDPKARLRASQAMLLVHQPMFKHVRAVASTTTRCPA